MKRRTRWLILLLVFLVAGGILYALGSDCRIFASPNRIGVIEVRGLIEDVQETVRAIGDFEKDPFIKALVVRIESPGGGIGPSQELYRALLRARDKKPVVASLGSVAASGGYYIASATSRIISNPGTITGSIGVISYFPNLRELFDKIGYTTVVVKSGKFKDVGYPGREMTPEEKELLQGTINEAHRQFVRDIVQGRSLPEEKVLEIADGRILMGEAAHRLGLVDELGNFQDALDSAAQLGRIEGEPTLIHHKKKKRSVLDYLLGTDVGDRLASLTDMTGSFLRYQMPLFP
ncbi:MAG TPA: signal peptide peptidase SppA [Syntrophobacteraceae bacterium]|nr:signal peptide peptidase SppA [Syntrophobacteraceae bacterium]